MATMPTGDYNGVYWGYDPTWKWGEVNPYGDNPQKWVMPVLPYEGFPWKVNPPTIPYTPIPSTSNNPYVAIEELIRQQQEEAARQLRNQSRREARAKKKQQETRIAMFLATISQHLRSLFRTYFQNPKDESSQAVLMDALEEADLSELRKLVSEGWMP